LVSYVPFETHPVINNKANKGKTMAFFKLTSLLL
jgi:hypothetical protein